jgi:hypothetical protein
MTAADVTPPWPMAPAYDEEAGLGAAVAAFPSTGTAAADTGSRSVAERGSALLVRPDADGPPAAGWIAAAGTADPSSGGRCPLPGVVRATARHGRHRPELGRPRGEGAAGVPREEVVPSGRAREHGDRSARPARTVAHSGLRRPRARDARSTLPRSLDRHRRPGDPRKAHVR